MKTKRSGKKRGRIIAGIVAVLIAAALLGTWAISSRNKNRTPPASQIRSADLETGTILSTVSAAGVLRGQEAEAVCVPEGVALDELLVSPGDRVTQGQVLGRLSPSSVLAALDDTQKQLDRLALELDRSEADAASGFIKANARGRVKEIYARENDRVADVMAEHGGLLLLSLDGKMELSLPASDAADVGDTVTVRLDGGKTETGTVEEKARGQMLITLTDNGPVNGSLATVSTADGTELGSAVLSVHCPLLVTGYTGLVASVWAEPEQTVWAGTNLLELSSSGPTPTRLSLLEQRDELVGTLRELIALQESGTLTAPFAGVVESISAASSADGEILRLIPDDNMLVDLRVYELDILSVAVGQEVMLTVDALGGEALSGTVSGINELGESSGGVTRYTVEITLARTENMRAGMNASAEIVVSRHENCRVIPEAALVQSGTTTFVYTAFDEESGDLSGERPVTTGASDGEYVEILSGLSDGERVYYRYAQPEDDADRARGGFPF